MKLTAPTTSTKIVDLLSTTQLAQLNTQHDNARNSSLRIEAHGGTLWWTAFSDDDAVIDECCSILDGDIEIISLTSAIQLDEIKVIAGSGVTFNIEIV